jgi:hypothetical protein
MADTLAVRLKTTSRPSYAQSCAEIVGRMVGEIRKIETVLPDGKDIKRNKMG